MKYLAALIIAATASAAAINEPRSERDSVHVVRQEGSADSLSEAQKSCTEEDGEYCTILAVADEWELFGTAYPRDVMDKLWDECLENSCNIGTYTYETTKTAGLGSVADDYLTVEPHGEWHPDFRHTLIFAMTELAGQTADEGEIEGISNPRMGGAPKLDVWWGPKNMAITRFHWDSDEDGGGKWRPDGSLTVTVDSQEDGNDACSIIAAAASAVAGLLNDKVGAAVGVASSFCGLVDM